MAYSAKAREHYTGELGATRDAGLYKDERFIHSPQGADIAVEFPEGAEVKEVINLCANNYLGLSSHPDVVKKIIRHIRVLAMITERGRLKRSAMFISSTIKSGGTFWTTSNIDSTKLDLLIFCFFATLSIQSRYSRLIFTEIVTRSTFFGLRDPISESFLL